MKATAFFMAICMALISVFAGNVHAMTVPSEMECCQHAGKKIPCEEHGKQAAKQGMCLTRLCCNVTGFTPVQPVALAELKPVIKGPSLFYLADGMPAGYVSSAFQPPEV